MHIPLQNTAKKTLSKLSFRPFSEDNLNKLISRINNFDWNVLSSGTLDSFMLNFTQKLNNLYCECFPTKIKYVSQKYFENPWITRDIIKLINYKSLYFNMYRKGVISSDINNAFKNRVNKIIKKSKIHYFENAFNSSKNDIKKTWKHVNSLKGRHSGPKDIEKLIFNDEEFTDVPGIAEIFNNYFNNIAHDLSSNLPRNNLNPISLVQRNISSFFLAPVTESEVSSVILNLNVKKPTLNLCPDFILKRIHNSIAPILCKIINSSFQNSVFPDSLKIANISPIFKQGDPHDVSNYRPISVLSSFSKIVEKCMLSRLWKFINKFNILTPQQYGFIKGKSTEDAVVSLTEELYKNLNSYNHSIAVFVDFKKAFDTVDHQIMLDKLEAYGIRGPELAWFASYLSGRKHSVKIKNYCSEFKNLSIGLPQGSLLSPVLFLLYINDLANLSKNIFPIMYADDTTLCFSNSCLTDLFNVCNSELSKFHQWTIANKLTLNVNKTNYMIISNRISNYDPLAYNLYINQNPLECKSNVKFLGVILDNKLNFNEHIKYVCNKVSKSIGVINSIKSFIPLNVLKSLYYSFVYPYIHYCIAAWGGTWSTHLQPLRILQKRAIRVINKKPYLHPSNQLFHSSEILKLDDVYKLKLCVYLYKNDLIEGFNRSHAHQTRFYSLLLPNHQRLTNCQKSIYFAGPNIWNELPHETKESRSLKILKSGLKNHFIAGYAEN